MIRIELTARHGKSGDYVGVRQDIATAAWNGQIFSAVSRSGASMAVARDLVAAGCPDQPWTAGRPGKTDCFGPTLHGLAQFTIAETDAGVGPRLARWQPYPRELPIGSGEP